MYEIWVEGWAATGQYDVAKFLGIWPGETFDAAVQEWNRQKNSKNTWGELEYRNGQWSVWGCKLFDNEADARKTFG